MYTPDLASKLGMDGARLRFLAFVDTGKLRQNHAPDASQCGATACGFSATSVGAGVRLSMRNGIAFRFDYGQVRDAGVEGDRGDDRVHFSMSVAF